PRLALIVSAEDALRTRIENAGIVWRDQQRKRPLKAETVFRRTMAANVERPHRDILHFVAAAIEDGDAAILCARIDDVRVARIHDDERAFTAADRVPMLAPDVTFIGAAGDSYGGVVLLRAVKVIRK